MKRRDLFGRLAAVAVAVTLAPAAKAEAGPGETVTVESLIAECEAEGHTLVYRDWGPHQVFYHYPYGERVMPDGSTWSEREEMLTFSEPKTEQERLTFAHGWLSGVHALHPAVPRILPPSTLEGGDTGPAVEYYMRAEDVDALVAEARAEGYERREFVEAMRAESRAMRG
jgi:hypothetical protein